MVVICIEDNGVYLKRGKSYEVIRVDSNYFIVVNDIGSLSEYHQSHFQ